MTNCARLARAGAPVAIVLVASLTGCTSSTTRLPLAECAVGLWVRTLGACDCAFASTPECASPTCQEYLTVTALRTDGTQASFALRFTTDAPRTISVVAGVSEGSWEATDAEHLDWHFGSIPSVFFATCTASSLAIGPTEYERAPPTMSDALLPVLRDMTRWRGVPY